jgi:hypothetical protein
LGFTKLVEGLTETSAFFTPGGLYCGIIIIFKLMLFFVLFYGEECPIKSLLSIFLSRGLFALGSLCLLELSYDLCF